MTIAQLARRAGVNPATVRYYERRGLIPPPPRRVSGYRIYGDDHLRQLGFIKRAKAVGFTLREIRELLALRLDPAADCSEVRRQAAEKLADIEQRLSDLDGMRRVLSGLVQACGGSGATNACPILGALELDL